MTNYANIPNELKAYAQWVNWIYVQRDEPPKKPTKVPLNPNTGEEAKVNDASTFGTFEQACNNVYAGRAYGIGFVLTDNDPFAFIDLDVPADEVQAEIIKEVFNRFDTYAEASPSGNGVHMILRGSVASGKNKRPVELYSRLRFMTMTGNVVKAVPIQQHDALLLTLWEEMGGAKEYKPLFESEPERYGDEEMYNKAANAKNGADFLKLWQGNWQGAYGSQSDADMALMNILAHYSHNHEQLARMFRFSAMGKRAKAWRETYLFHPSYGLVSKALDRAVKVIPMDGLLSSGWQIIQAQAQAAQQKENDRLQALNDARMRKHEEAEALARQQAAKMAPTAAHVSPYSFGAPLQQGEQFPAPPGLVGKIAEFIYRQSPYPLPQTALVGALGFMAGLCGRAYNVSGLGCNTYLLLVAPTSAGKETMQSGISKLANSIRAQVPAAVNSFGHAYFASGQALYREIKAHKCILTIQGEFGIELNKMTAPRAPESLKMLKRAYLELFTKSGKGQFLGKSSFADREKDSEGIEAPCLSIIAETAPPHLYDSLNETMLSDGFLPRFAIVEVETAEETYNPQAFHFQPDRELIEGVVRLAMDTFRMTANNLVQDVTFDAEAQMMQDEYRAVCRRKCILESSEATKQLWSRAHTKAMKIAALIAVGCTFHAGQTPTITTGIFEWAARLVNDGIARLERRFERGDIGEGDSRAIADMRAFVVKYASNPVHLLAKSGLKQEHHAEGILTYSYMLSSIHRLASLRSGAGGSQQTFNRSLIALVDAGMLVPLSPDDLAKRNINGKAFRVSVTE